MREKSDRSLRTSELVRTRERIVRRCSTAENLCQRSHQPSGTNELTLPAIGGCFGLIHWNAITTHGVFDLFSSRLDINIPSVPDKVLEEFVLVLALHNDSRSLNNVSGVRDEPLAIWRELRGIHRRVLENILKGLVDLGIRGHPALTECLDNSIQADLADGKLAILSIFGHA